MAFFSSKKKGGDNEKGSDAGSAKPGLFSFLKPKSKQGADDALNKEDGTGKKIPVSSAFQSFKTPWQSTAEREQESSKARMRDPERAIRDQITEKIIQQGAGQGAKGKAQLGGAKASKPTRMQIYFASIAAKHKGLDAALRAEGIKESPYEFVKKMFIYAAIVSAVITISAAALLLSYGVTPIFAVVLGIGCFQGLFGKFIQYPVARSTVVGKEIEKDILFAARDLVISMRSGMPLFNAITAVSTGYGAASLEFAKVVELVQLGSPIEQALDDVSTKSQSKTFKRIMLQATVSLKAGADVVGALQGVVEEVQQERVIELRRYGQRLNALAMFYMLFGVIFPSMGIAVAAILTTFINIFSITNTTLLMAAVGIFFLQLVFLNIMRGSRPVFAM